MSDFEPTRAAPKICPATGKRQYGSKEAARKALSKHRGSVSDLHAYRCGKCHGWRNGHCKGCGQFWAGVESFEFGERAGYCDTCRGQQDAADERDAEYWWAQWERA